MLPERARISIELIADMKTKYLAVMALVIAATIGGVLVARHQPAKIPTPIVQGATPSTVVQSDTGSTEAQPVSMTGPAFEQIAPVPAEPEKEIAWVKPTQPAKVAKQKSSGNSGKQKDPIQDPDARAALSLVGVDPEAEAYWASAINDPSLPAEERKDLIEDLNEDGLSDPHHPSLADMPLIVSRLQLIEELAPNAMDQVNADAFAEAYKDLLGMAFGQAPQ